MVQFLADKSCYISIYLDFECLFFFITGGPLSFFVVKLNIVYMFINYLMNETNNLF